MKKLRGGCGGREGASRSNAPSSRPPPTPTTPTFSPSEEKSDEREEGIGGAEEEERSSSALSPNHDMPRQCPRSALRSRHIRKIESEILSYTPPRPHPQPQNSRSAGRATPTPTPSPPKSKKGWLRQSRFGRRKDPGQKNRGKDAGGDSNGAVLEPSSDVQCKVGGLDTAIAAASKASGLLSQLESSDSGSGSVDSAKWALMEDPDEWSTASPTGQNTAEDDDGGSAGGSGSLSKTKSTDDLLLGASAAELVLRSSKEMLFMGWGLSQTLQVAPTCDPFCFKDGDGAVDKCPTPPRHKSYSGDEGGSSSESDHRPEPGSKLEQDDSRLRNGTTKTSRSCNKQRRRPRRPKPPSTVES